MRKWNWMREMKISQMQIEIAKKDGNSSKIEQNRKRKRVKRNTEVFWRVGNTRCYFRMLQRHTRWPWWRNEGRYKIWYWGIDETDFLMLYTKFQLINFHLDNLNYLTRRRKLIFSIPPNFIKIFDSNGAGPERVQHWGSATVVIILYLNATKTSWSPIAKKVK